MKKTYEQGLIDMSGEELLKKYDDTNPNLQINTYNLIKAELLSRLQSKEDGLRNLLQNPELRDKKGIDFFLSDGNILPNGDMTSFLYGAKKYHDYLKIKIDKLLSQPQPSEKQPLTDGELEEIIWEELRIPLSYQDKVQNSQNYKIYKKVLYWAKWARDFKPQEKKCSDCKYHKVDKRYDKIYCLVCTEMDKFQLKEQPEAEKIQETVMCECKEPDYMDGYYDTHCRTCGKEMK